MMHWNPLRSAVKKTIPLNCERSLLKLWEHLRHRRICKAQTVTFDEGRWAAVDCVDLGCVYIIKPAPFKSDCFGQIVCRDSLHSQTFT